MSNGISNHPEDAEPDAESPLECVVTLYPGGRSAAVDEAEEILLGHSERLRIFQRAGELVRIISLPEPCRSSGLRRPKGTVQLQPLSALALTEVFDRIVRWQKLDREGNPEPTDCPDKIPKLYLSRVGSWRLPVLTGIITAPILRKDGTILMEPGYDKNTGLFLVSEEIWPSIPDRPTAVELKNALRTICNPFSEFPFVAEEDRSVQVAAILTALQRRSLGACPIFGYSAPAQRSGKSLLAESVAIVGTGKPAPATAVSPNREEMRKAITSSLREGHSIINLDNIIDPLASPDLAKVLTQDEYQDRILGESRMLRLPTNTLWTATGNNLTFRGDLSSRALLCRIDSGMEQPEERTFRNPSLKNFLMHMRKRIVVAALTILRAYHVAGRPRQDVPPWGGFEDWSRSIREPLVWAGLADPCKTRENVVADDPEREEANELLLALWETFRRNGFTVKELIDRCESDAQLRDAVLVVAAKRNAQNEIDHWRIGSWLRRWQDRILCNLQLRRSRKLKNKVAHWKVEHHQPTGGQ